MKKFFCYLLVLCVCALCPENGLQMSFAATEDGITPADTDIPDDLAENANTLSIVCTEGTQDCWQFEDGRLRFSDLGTDTVCLISGTYDGQIVIDAGDDCKFELELCGLTLYSGKQNPVEILSGDKITIKAVKDSVNYIYDTRAAMSGEVIAHSAAVYSACDLALSGKGMLTVISENNNGIHTKKTLSAKDLTLVVTCRDNALKGNDGVEITSGCLTLIAKAENGIKTSDTNISKKGNQHGNVGITGGTVVIYAGCDGIDAAYDVYISGNTAVDIHTDRYSPYTDRVETTPGQGSVRYIRFTSDKYSYSVKYINSDTDYLWENAVFDKKVSAGRGYCFYTFDVRTDYDALQVFIYTDNQQQGQEENYTAKSDCLAWNDDYDTFALEARYGTLSYGWANHSSPAFGRSGGGNTGGPGGWGAPGGFGGMMDGNTEKGDHSAKGIKAGNEIRISGGALTIESYDDSLHANNSSESENGSTTVGNVTVSGGTLTLYTKDDAIHADSTLTVEGGTICITNCYEGLEGNNVIIRGGEISVTSSDDGINATATTGVGILFEGGRTYLYAGGDGIDSNSRDSYQGIVFAGGEITVISTSGMNSSIDTERGYSYTGGTVLALCPSGGMGNESTKCENFSSVATKTTMRLEQGQTLSVKVNGELAALLEMPCQLSALVIYLGSPEARFEVG